ncbi:GroES-like protein [Aspergillus steynii IBT 23096]|uniref:GroES-like protein n=1 Tax=Aspergillus steynii IBT 23096 TaxID=1392250 RepID=A0A2I2FVZ6_9EURO|nr:GroES-like protein [Aspergillus steynii IBT 23096]PLB44823.1 GroES-like protein [Aspergillus steynii IBT 23096]
MADTPQHTITALRYYGQKDPRLEQIPARACGPNEVRVKVAYCGICGSDIHEYLGGPIFPPKPGERHPWTGQSLPVTLGHEMSGVVVELGSAVTGLQAGSKVSVNPALDDRHYGTEPCTTCQLGKRNICKRYASYGMSAEGGGFASEIVVNAINCIILPDSVSLRVGALLEPLAVAWHSIRLSGFQIKQTAVVLGAGPIGLAIVMLLRVWGARTIVVSEVTPSRKRMAVQFGADVVVDPSEKSNEDPVLSAIYNINVDGADVVFDATGLQVTLDTAIAAVRPGGTVFNVAVHEKPLQLNLNDLVCFEKRLMGGICYTMEDFIGVLQALESGNAPAEDMITSIVSLNEVVEKGFLELINNKAAHVKILVDPAMNTELRNSRPRL